MWIREFGRRLTILFRRGRFERDLEEEMQFHLQLQDDENRENGMPADDAHFAARRQFGNPTVLKEAGWEMWGWGSVERLLQDLRYALRMLLIKPRYAAALVPLAVVPFCGSPHGTFRNRPRVPLLAL